MTEPDARSVVLDYLTLAGWTPEAEGPAGELWVRGNAEAVVPRSLRAESSPWNRLAVALSRADNVPTDDLLTLWRNRLVHSMEVRAAASPRARSGSGRTELEVHLDGATVVEHQADAYDFGRFVMRTSDSVKELVKSARGTRHHARKLLIVGAPREGSVLVTFREPDNADPTALITESLETVEGQALAFMATVFTAATASATETNADGLRSHLGPLDARARHSVARVAEVLLDGGWTLTGTIRRGGEEAAVELGPHAAHVLSMTSREGYEEERVEPVTGTLDGWVWSASELTLITEDRGRIRVSVPMSLQAQVGELHAVPETRVAARLNVFRRLASGTRDTVQTTYTLAAIDPLDHPNLTD